MKFLVLLNLFFVVLKLTEALHCEQVEINHKKGGVDRYVTDDSGERHNVSVLWGGRTPSRGVAALLVIIIKYGLRYPGAHLRKGPEDLCGLAKISWIRGGEWHSLVMALSAAWTPAASCEGESLDSTYKFAGKRLDLVGPGLVPVSLRLLAYMPPEAKDCPIENLWYPYDAGLDKKCQFLKTHELQSQGVSVPQENCGSQSCIAILYPTEWKKVADELSRRIQYLAVPFHLIPFESDEKPRIKLLKLLEERRSFLFLDHSIWESFPRVHLVSTPPCPPNFKCPIPMDDTTSIAVADSKVFEQFAPDIFSMMRDFTIEATELQDIIKKEAQLQDPLEAACSWAIENEVKFKKFSIRTFVNCSCTIVILYCKDDPDINTSNRILAKFKKTNSNCNVSLLYDSTNCDDLNELSVHLEKINDQLNSEGNVAGVIGAGLGASVISDKVANLKIPLVLYDALSPRVKVSSLIVSASGSVLELGYAIRHFIHMYNWNRVVILSEDNWYAKDFYDTVFKEKNIIHRDFKTGFDNTEEKLNLIKRLKAKIIIVNTKGNLTKHILCEALTLNMTSPNGYVWILREWRKGGTTCDITDKMRHYTLTYGFRGGNLSLPSFNLEGFRKNVDQEFGNVWPQHANAQINALQLLATGYYKLMETYPKYRHEFSEHAAREWLKILRNSSIEGVEGSLNINSNLTVNSYIYVDEWSNGHRLLHGIWNLKGDKVNILKTFREIQNPELFSDGTTKCYTTSNGEAFSPFCHDITYAIAFLVILFFVPIIYKTRQIRVKKLKRNESKWISVLLQEKDRLTTELLPHEVDISELEFQKSVHSHSTASNDKVKLAILRRSGFPEQIVQVHTLQNDSAVRSTNFLREASLLASLNDKNIVKFLGVCTKESWMILTEYAYYGNLMRYLEKRSLSAELAHSGKAVKESEHVSCLALTQMAVDVASALKYLASRRIVHRDVRAKQCLVDVHRRVKLSNFSMARDLNWTEEYCDRGKGAYPLVFMPRESILYGKFSPASDMWSYGVFLLELVKLGARPYDLMTQEDIAQHVVDRKKPPIPFDASVHTRELVHACCQTDPDDRMTAAQVLEYLAKHPLALQPTVFQEETTENSFVQ